MNISEDVTGVKDDLLLKNLIVYPNPIEDKLFVEMPGNESQLQLEVIDIFGTRIYQSTLEEKIKIDTRTFVPGIYLIRLEDGLSRMFVKVN